jgi:hypothetical protein
LLRRFSFWLTLFAAAVSVYNALGYDRDNFLVNMISVPVWFIEIFQDIHAINPLIIYLLTIGSWLLFGMLLDAGLQKRKKTAKP